jgi:hypothetical protein
MWIRMPDALLKQVEAQLDLFGFGQAPPPQVIVIIHACFAALSLINLSGAVQMLRMRMYPLALVGSFLSMLNCGSYCCALGLPFGIWSVIVLLRPDVRSAFR